MLTFRAVLAHPRLNNPHTRQLDQSHDSQSNSRLWKTVPVIIAIMAVAAISLTLAFSPETATKMGIDKIEHLVKTDINCFGAFAITGAVASLITLRIAALLLPQKNEKKEKKAKKSKQKKRAITSSTARKPAGKSTQSTARTTSTPPSPQQTPASVFNATSTRSTANKSTPRKDLSATRQNLEKPTHRRRSQEVVKYLRLDQVQIPLNKGFNNTGASCYIATALQGLFYLMDLAIVNEETIFGPTDTPDISKVTQENERNYWKNFAENRKQLITILRSMRQTHKKGSAVSKKAMTKLQNLLSQNCFFNASRQDDFDKPWMHILNILVPTGVIQEKTTTKYPLNAEGQLEKHYDEDHYFSFSNMITVPVNLFYDNQGDIQQPTVQQALNAPALLVGREKYLTRVRKDEDGKKTEKAKKVDAVKTCEYLAKQSDQDKAPPPFLALKLNYTLGEFPNARKIFQHLPLDEKITSHGIDYRLIYFSKYGGNGNSGHYYGVRVSKDGMQGAICNDSAITKGLTQNGWKEESEQATMAIYVPVKQSEEDEKMAEERAIMAAEQVAKSPSSPPSGNSSSSSSSSSSSASSTATEN
ncbi:hypothetical protein SCG7109_AD_00190 [Chlamydiales bacterium SCGC AG-110-M15]|nr:hypothetical protein SCG7109_AD_00190 [Chlamydiales bacterium SCGC AG-110-M15]